MGRLLVTPTIVAAVAIGTLMVPSTAMAEPPTTSAPTSPRDDVPDVSSPVPSADADAQTQARDDVPEVVIPPDSALPAVTDPVALAAEEAARTGQPVVVDEQTTPSSITTVMPDGTVSVDSAAGPVRVQQDDGTWIDVDTTLQVTDTTPDEAGGEVVAPVMVPGATQFSAGGDDLLASLSDRADTTITMAWPEKLPAPVLDGDTATYPDVLPNVDLVLTATRLGFSQLLVVNSPPTAETAAALASIDIPVTTTGAVLDEGAGGELQVIDPDTATDPNAAPGTEGGDTVIGNAAAPLMWDARTDPRSDEPVAQRPVGLEVTSDPDAPATATFPAEATLTLTPDMGIFTDPTTVYPVTIDPTQTLGALGSTFVQSNIANTPQGGSTELRAGTYTSGVAARSFLRFDVSAMKNRPISSATFAAFEFHSWSCSPRAVDVRETGDFNPNTVTWGSQPPIYGVSASQNVAWGYNSSCPAQHVYWDITGLAQSYVNGKGTVMPLAITANESDVYGWKKFNSATNANYVPHINFTYNADCDQINGQLVCGMIRNKYNELGGAGGFLGLPINSETPISGGWFNAFQGGSIYASSNPNIGVHFIRGAIFDRWGATGYENGYLGYPITDENCGLVNGGCFQHFSGGSIYYSPASGAWDVNGLIRDKWAATGYENGPLGYPVNPPGGIPTPAGTWQPFQGGAMYLAGGASTAYYVSGAIRSQWEALDYERSYLAYPTSDPYDVFGGLRSDFQGGQITWDADSNTTQWGAGPSTSSGMPGWATNLSFRPTDLMTANVNVATGNLNLTTAGLTVPGVGGDRGIGVVYNSLQTATGSVDRTGLLGAGFRLTESPDVRLVPYGDTSVRYVDATGRAAVFEWNAAAGRYDNTVGDGGFRMTRTGAGNASGDWVLTELASNRKMTFRAADGLLISDADRNGLAYTFSYDTNGRPTTITGTRGGSGVTFTIGGTGVPAGHVGKMTQTIDGTTRTVTFGYNTDSRLTSIVDASGKTTSFTWTGTDITRITAPNGTVTAISYDTSHRVTQYVLDYGSGKFNRTTKLAYDFDFYGGYTHLTVSVTSPNNQVTTYRADAFGKVLDATDPLGHTQAGTYSPNNDVLTAVDAMPGANTTNYSYNGPDGGYTPTGVQLPTGASASANYPGTGTGPLRYLPSSATDTQGNATSISYDAVGNPTSQITGGISTSTTYNPPAGQATTCAGGGKPGQPCTKTDGRGGVTTLTYDTAGNLRTVTPPTGVIKATSYTYDGAGRPKTVTDGRSQVTTYIYDANDRVTQVRYNGATSCATAANCQVYTYDANGNLTKRVDAGGTTTYGYDALNRLTSTTLPAGSAGGASTVSMTYDLVGNTLTFTDLGGTTRYGYDAGNNLTSLAEPGGSCTGTISRCTTYTYDANDRRTAIAYPGGSRVEYRNIDGAGRPLDYWARSGNGTVVMDFNYTFTRNGADTGVVQTRTDRLNPGGQALQAYTYDGLNRLTRAKETVGATTTAQWSYCLDANGNRTFDSTSTAATVLCPGQSGGPTAGYTYDATDALTGRAGQATTAFSYDNNGNELKSVGVQARTAATYNARDQLTALTSNNVATSFTYAGEGNKERLTAGTSSFATTPLGVTARINNGGSPQYVIREPNGTITAIRTGTTSHYVIADRQNSVTRLVDSAGVPQNSYSYDPYGTSRAKTEPVANPYQYIGAPLDANGLYHLQNRYYDPSIGRFTQPDPSGQESNSYAYSSANPTTNADPTGLSWVGDVLQGASTAIGVASSFLPGPYGLAGGVVSAGLGIAAGVVNGDSAGEIATGAIVDVAGGALGAVGDALDVAPWAARTVDLTYEGIGALGDYA